MGAYSWIRTGTVACTPASNIVVGTATAWTSVPLAAGDEFTADNRVGYEIVNVIDDTHIQIDRAWESDAYIGAYAVKKNFSPLGATLMAAVQQTLNIFKTLLGGTPVQFVAGVPAAAAIDGVFALDTLNDTLYVQQAGAWTPIAGTGGGGGAGGGAVTPLGTLGATTNVDVSTARIFTATLGAAACSIKPATTGIADNVFVTVLMRLTQDATGSRALAAAAGVTWAGSSNVPGINPAPGSLIDVQYSSFDGGRTWVAAIVSQTAGA